jgi:hypothetical protein
MSKISKHDIIPYHPNSPAHGDNDAHKKAILYEL